MNKTIMVCTKIVFDMMREGFEHAKEPVVEIVASEGELYYLMIPPNDND